MIIISIILLIFSTKYLSLIWIIFLLGLFLLNKKMYKYFLDEFDDNRHQDIVNNFKQLLRRMNEYHDDILVKEWQEDD